MGVTPTVPEKTSDKSVVAWASPLMKGHNPGTNKEIEIAGAVFNLSANLTVHQSASSLINYKHRALSRAG